MVLAAAVDDDVLVEVGLLGLEPVEAGDVAADLADGHRQAPQVRRAVDQADPDADREGSGRGVSHRRSTLPAASSDRPQPVAARIAGPAGDRGQAPS